MLCVSAFLITFAIACGKVPKVYLIFDTSFLGNKDKSGLQIAVMAICSPLLFFKYVVYKLRFLVFSMF